MKSQLKELFILHFLNDGVRTSIIVLLPFIAKDLSLSLGQAGFLGSSQPLIASLLALPAGFLIGRMGGFHMIFSLLIVYSVGVVGIALSFNVFILFAMYLLAALGFGMFHTVGFALTAHVSNDTNVGRNMGNFTSIGEVGRVALPPIMIFIASVTSWRLTLILLGAIGFILFFIARFYMPTKEIYRIDSDENTSQNHKDFLRDTMKLFKNKRAVLLTMSSILDSFASSPIYVYLPFLLLTKGITASELSLTMGGFFVGSLLGKTILGRSIDRYGSVKVLICSEVAMAVSLIIISQSAGLILLIFLSILLGIFTKGTSPVVQAMFSELSDKNHYHKIFAVSELVIGSAAVLTITVLGVLGDKNGIVTIFYVAAILALMSTFFIYAFSKTKGAGKIY